MQTPPVSRIRFRPRRITVPLFLSLLVAAALDRLSQPDVVQPFAAYAVAH